MVGVPGNYSELGGWGKRTDHNPGEGGYGYSKIEGGKGGRVKIGKLSSGGGGGRVFRIGGGVKTSSAPSPPRKCNSFKWVQRSNGSRWRKGALKE